MSTFLIGCAQETLILPLNEINQSVKNSFSRSYGVGMGRSYSDHGDDLRKDIEENVAVIGDAVNSLTKATLILQSIRENGINFLFQNVELFFPKAGIDFHKAKKQYEVSLVEQALRHSGGKQSEAAKLLNLRKSTLNAIIKRNNIGL